MTLEPGQSVTQTTPWNGVPDKLPSGSSNGSFTVTDELDPRAESTTFQIIAPPAADLSTKVTTDKSVYQYGEPIQLTLTETNVSSQPIAVLTGPAAFVVTHDGAAVMQSAVPSSLPASTTWETLGPGQAYSQTFSWSGTTEYTVTSPQATGTFTASNLLDPNGATATFQIVAPVSLPISVPPFIPAPPPSTGPVTATLVANQPAYKPGESIRLSMVLQNQTAAKVSVAPVTQGNGITVMDGSAVVFHSVRIRPSLFARSIKPHHSVKLDLVWSGRGNQPGVKNLTAGTYTVQVVEGGYIGTTTVRIVR